MDNNFNKFKNKIIIETLIKCFAYAFCLSVISFFSVFLLIKLNITDFNLLYLVLIAIGELILVGGVLFLIFKPSKMKIAKRIDKELNLNEKVQTMIEYIDDEGLMKKVQREDTLNILSKTSVKKISFKISLLLIIMLVLSLGVCVTALCIPSVQDDEIINNENNNPNKEDDLIYETDDWTIRALLDLIEEVKLSTCNESLKASYLILLQSLIETLEEEVTVVDIKNEIREIISVVEFQLDLINTNNEIYTVLRESDTILIDKLAIQINLLNVTQVENALVNFSLLISGSTEAIRDLSGQFGELLKKSQLNKEDNLYKTLLDFSNSIDNAALSDDVNNAVNETIDKYSAPILNEIVKQAENKRISDYIIEQLTLIFGLNDENIENENPGEVEDPSDDDEKDNPEGNGPGGYGSGDLVFGSDDMFFDPETGKIMYGEVITKYESHILNIIENGELSEEHQEYFKSYFDLLFGDFKKDE